MTISKRTLTIKVALDEKAHALALDVTLKESGARAAGVGVTTARDAGGLFRSVAALIEAADMAIAEFCEHIGDDQEAPFMESAAAMKKVALEPAEVEL
jgi:hypothetical protein